MNNKQLRTNEMEKSFINEIKGYFQFRSDNLIGQLKINNWKKKIEMQQQDKVYFYNVHSQPFSNFYSSPFTVADKIYQTAQNFYQSKKFEGTQKQQQVRTSPTIQSCHYMGQSYSSTFDHHHWDSIRQQVYEQAMRHKFTQNKDLMDKLLMTDNKQIINIDDDTFWGMKFDDLQGKLTGENKTGKILMKIRDQFNKAR